MIRQSWIAAILAVMAFTAGAAGGEEQYPKNLFAGKAEPQPDGTVKLTWEFDDPAELKDWQGVAEAGGEGSKAFLSGGALEVKAEKGEAKFARLAMPFTGDITIEARARLNPPKGKEILFLLYEGGDEEGYRCSVAYMEKGKPNAYVIKLGQSEPLKKSPQQEMEQGEWYPIRVKVAARAISLTVDKRLVLQCADDEFRRGRIGVGTWGSNVSFDSITVQGKVDEAWMKERAASAASSPDPGALSVPGEAAMLGAMSGPGKDLVLSGKKQFALGNTAKAEGDFEKAAASDPGSPLPWILAGLCRLARGRTSAAEEAFGKAVAAGPECVQAYLLRARARMAGGSDARSLDDAVRDLRAAIALCPGSPEPFFDLATALYLRGKFDGAAAAAQKAFRLADAASAEGPEAEAAARAELKRKAEAARDAYAWGVSGPPLRSARKGAGQFGEVISDAGQEEVDALCRAASSASAAISLLTGKPVSGIKIYLVAEEKVASAFRFPGAMIEQPDGSGYLDVVRGHLVLRAAAGGDALSRAVGSLLARSSARSSGAAVWIEEALALYFDVAPEGGERPRLGTAHPTAAAAAKRVLSGQKPPTASALVASDRAGFAADRNLAALAWSLLHCLLHGADPQPDFLRRVFESGGSAGDFDAGGIDGKWKKHVAGLGG